MIFFTRYRRSFVPAQISLLLLAVATLSSCGKEEIVIDEQLLTKYDSIAHPASITEPSDSIDCYLDYSYGMQEGMKASFASNFELTNWFSGKKVNYYKIGASDIPVRINLSSSESHFTDPANFKEAGSKLKVAIDKITSNKNKVSLFITDFERVDDVKRMGNPDDAPADHPIEATAWASESFTDWLNAGNQIDIFAEKFSKPDYWFDKNPKNKYENWVYTLVFTPGAIIKNETFYKKSLLATLSKAHVSSNDSKHFIYTTNHFLIEQKKQDDAIGDANDNLIVQENITITKNKGFEYYYFKSSDLVNFNADDSQKDKRIINKITVTSLAPCFSDIQYGIAVYDITQSITDFYAAQNQQAPEVVSDVETGKKDTVANKPVHYNYQKGTPADDVFDFTYNSETKETGIKLKPDFIGVEETTIYRVDLIVDSTKLVDFAEEDRVLKLSYKEHEIKALGKSIKGAMNTAALALENKVLYTVYIKIDNQ